MAHGGYLPEAGGGVIDPSLADIKATQAHYLKELRKQSVAAIERPSVADEVIGNAHEISQLLDEVRPAYKPHWAQVNSRLLRLYVKEHLPTGSDASAAGELLVGKQALGTEVETINAYVNLCADYKVPIPSRVPVRAEWSASDFPGWKDRGYLGTDFLSLGSSIPQLLTYESESPPGLCMALPRWRPQNSSGQTAIAMGLICLSYLTNKACFFDIENVSRSRQSVPIEDFMGAKGIKDNQKTGGICTDCHAGENPFIIHPEDSSFRQLSDQKVRTTNGYFYDPIVWPDWPQNLYAINSLPPLPPPPENSPAQQSCGTCHNAGLAAFPDVTRGNLRGYCRDVLSRAVDSSTHKSNSMNPFRTMPPLYYGESQRALTPANLLMPGVSFPEANELAAWDARFSSHRSWLLSACSPSPSGGITTQDIPKKDNPNVLSPPLISEPIYKCASSIHVGSVVVGATVELFVGGTSVGVQTVESPGGVTFSLSSPVPSDMLDVVAVQSFLGAQSSSPSSKTREYQQDYPNGLPTPSFNPDVHYQCASKVTVQHVHGATLTVGLINSQGTVQTRTSGGGGTSWTVGVSAPRAFQQGDGVRVMQSLCGDDSDWSAYSPIQDPPSTLPKVKFKPETPFEGQRFTDFFPIIPGANIEAMKRQSPGNQVIGSANTGSWPFAYMADFSVVANLSGPIGPKEKLSAQQHLCQMDSPPTSTPDALPCEQLPAPVITTPVEGAQFVFVTDSIPGARIHVWDASSEIGDATGKTIALTKKLLAGETIVVTQSVGEPGEECRSRFGYSVVVRPKSNGDPPGDDGGPLE